MGFSKIKLKHQDFTASKHSLHNPARKKRDGQHWALVCLIDTISNTEDLHEEIMRLCEALDTAQSSYRSFFNNFYKGVSLRHCFYLAKILEISPHLVNYTEVAKLTAETPSWIELVYSFPYWDYKLKNFICKRPPPEFSPEALEMKRCKDVMGYIRFVDAYVDHMFAKNGVDYKPSQHDIALNPPPLVVPKINPIAREVHPDDLLADNGKDVLTVRELKHLRKICSKNVIEAVRNIIRTKNLSADARKLLIQNPDCAEFPSLDLDSDFEDPTSKLLYEDDTDLF